VGEHTGTLVAEDDRAPFLCNGAIRDVTVNPSRANQKDCL
jgi:hypothetical protein